MKIEPPTKMLQVLQKKISHD